MLQKVTQEPLTRDQLLQKETLKGINKQQLKRQITIINQKQQQKESRYQTATAGRNSLVVSVTLGKLFFKFAIGIFDEFSDWYYYFSTKGTFQLQILEDLMLYFLLVQFLIQIFAWALIFGKLFLKQVKYKTGNDPLIDIDEQTKNETSVFTWLCKTLNFNIYNALKITWYSIKSIPHAFVMMLLQETKISPFIIHGFFQYKYQVVLTEDLMENMTVQTKDKELKEKVLNLKEKYRRSKGLTLDDEEFQDEDPLKKNQNSIILKSIKLDSNMEPNLATFLFEADLEKYLRMADTIEAIFEALPLSIIQYINNELRGQSWDLISILSFGSSILTVFIYCVSLVQFLFQDDAETLWDQWTEMEKLKKQGKYLYHIYELPKKLTITAKRELLKLQHVSIKGLQKVKHLIVDLYKQSNESDSIISALKHLFPKTDCQTISLRMGECNMNFEHYQTLISNATTLKCEQFEMDLSDNFKMLHTGLDDDITLQIVKHDPIIKKLKDKDVATIDLVKENEKDFQRLTFYKFKALYVNCGIRFNDLLIMFKGLAPNLFITDFELNISNNQIFNQDLRNLDHDAISDFDVIENLDINFSDNFLEEQGIQILLELILLNFPSLSQLKIDFSNQKRSIFLSNLQGKPRINKTYKKGEVLYYEGKTFTKQELQNFQKYTVKKFNPISNSQVTLLEKMLQQSSKYYSQWNDFNFQEIPTNFPLKEKLDYLQLNLSNASISDYSLMQISQQLIGCHLNQLQTFELNLSQNPLGNQGIQYLAQYGFSKMEQAVHISVQLDELSYQFKNKIDLSGIIAFSDYLPRQIQKFTISAKQNEKMADTIFATDEICFSLSEKDIKLLEEDKNAKNPIPEQIRQLCKFNQDLISLQVVSNPSSDSEVPVSFRLNQKYIINLAKKMLLRPHLFSKQNVKQNFIQVTQIQDISQSINEFEQGLLIGRLNQAFAPPISFAQIDNSVSKKSALITKNEKGKYQIKCLSSASNPVSIRLQKGIKYQIFEKARIQVDRSYSSIQIDIQGLGQNDYLTESDKEFHPEIQSWSFLSKQTKTLQQLEEEEEELDSDRTINEDEMMIAPVKVEKKPQLPKSQISFSVKNLWTSGKNYFTFDIDPKKQEENEQDNSLVQNKISDFGKEEEEQILKHSSQNMLNKQPKKAKAKISQTNKIKGGTEQNPQLVNLSIFDKQKIKFGADENITNFPLKTVESQTQVERIHFIIGREKLGEKQIWYIKLDDDYHNDLSKVSETFLNLKKFDEPEQSENFDIYDNMQFNVGFTVMGLNLLGANSQEYLEKERNKQLEQKQSESSHVINLKIPNQ